MESLFSKQFSLYQKIGSQLSRKKEDYEKERNNRDAIHLSKIKSTLDDLNNKYQKQISKLDSTVTYYKTQIEKSIEIVDAKKTTLQKELDDKIEALTAKYEKLIENCNKDLYIKDCNQFIDTFTENINKLEEECQSKKERFMERPITKTELDLKVEIANLEVKREKEKDEMERLEAEEDEARIIKRKEEERNMAIAKDEKNRRKPKELQDDYNRDPRIVQSLYDDPNYNPHDDILIRSKGEIIQPITDETVLVKFATAIQVGETKKDERERERRQLLIKNYKEYVLDLHATIKKQYPKYGDYFEAIIMPDRSVLLRFLDDDCISLVGEEKYETRKDFLKKHPLLEEDLTTYNSDIHDLNLPKLD